MTKEDVENEVENAISQHDRAAILVNGMVQHGQTAESMMIEAAARVGLSQLGLRRARKHAGRLTGRYTRRQIDQMIAVNDQLASLICEILAYARYK